MGMNPFERAAVSGFYLILHCAVVLSSGEEVLVRPETSLLPLRRQPNVSAINSAGRLFEPERFRSDVLTMQHSETAFPIFNIVFFGLWQREEDAPLSGYTLGLDRFACPDLEILESPDAPAVIRAQMIAAAMVQITRGAALKDGEVLTLSGTLFKAELKASSAVPGAVTTHLTAIEKAPESEAPKKKKRF